MPIAVPDVLGENTDWEVIASDDVTVAPAWDETALQLDVEVQGAPAYVGVRRNRAESLKESFACCFRLRGESMVGRFEVRMFDASGRDTWRWHRDDFVVPDEWVAVEIASHELDFVAGSSGGGELRELGAIEITLILDRGGRGRLWFDDLQFEDRCIRTLPAVEASSSLPDHGASLVGDRSLNTYWQSGIHGPHWIQVDLKALREFGGLVLRWPGQNRPDRFAVQVSDDAALWRDVYCAEGPFSESSFVYLPRTNARHLRLNFEGGPDGVALSQLEIRPPDFSRTVATFFQHLAKRARTGYYPSWLVGRQSYWTPVGLPGGGAQGLLNEEGMAEIRPGGFSIEPFLRVDDRLLSWADVNRSPYLVQSELPIPHCAWMVSGLALDISLCAAGEGERAALYLRYRVINREKNSRSLRLYLTLRPFQVTPSWQQNDAIGGMSPIRRIVYDGDGVTVNDEVRVIPWHAPNIFGTVSFDQGPLGEALLSGEFSTTRAMEDGFGYGSAILAYDMTLPPGNSADWYVIIPYAGDRPGCNDALAFLRPVDAFHQALVGWRRTLNRLPIRLPLPGRALLRAMKTALGHILINRDGAALQAGPRRHWRCRIRDAAVLSAALLRCGLSDPVRDWLRWYTLHQREDGMLPGSIDAGGPNWEPAFDSQGQFIFTVAELVRFTGDTAFGKTMWPAVLKAVRHIEILRARRLTEAYRTPLLCDKYGLLPESAGRGEDYLDDSAHTYQDDFWALRGIADAAFLAELFGEQEQSVRLRNLSEHFSMTLFASINRVVETCSLEFLPASVEGAECDPAATATALFLVDDLIGRCPTLLQASFDRYLDGFYRRRDGDKDWGRYSTDEIRIVGALVRLGLRNQAHDLAKYFLDDRRPMNWNQWPEIAWCDPRTPGALGDIPHTRISAEFVMAFRSLLVYEETASARLVIAAGVPVQWLRDGGEVAVSDLPTMYGRLEYRIAAEREGLIVLSFALEPNQWPCTVVVKPPLRGPLRAAWLDGEILIDLLPDGVELRGVTRGDLRFRF